MAEEGTSSAASSTSDSSYSPQLHDPSKNVKSSKAMTRKDKPNHPSIAEMVTEAIVELAERGGSSLLAIKKYITKTYKLDVDKQAIYIKKYLKSAVAKGSLVQTTGRGASGSFKLPSAKQKAAMAKTASEENTIPVKKKSSKTAASATKPPSKNVEKKGSSVNMKSKGTASSTATPAGPKSPSKIKKTVKSPTSKPKSPKLKKVAVSKSLKVVSAKKTATIK